MCTFMEMERGSQLFCSQHVLRVISLGIDSAVPQRNSTTLECTPCSYVIFQGDLDWTLLGRNFQLPISHW
ncbi:hypothetical protein Y1Q_0005240 [Alligator mississippiensis]|uniref:Uncharacterized protein n=1 Tax=Alligator mississippiensis TaxID=8496 RepID=A0A151MT49_ALLMI|nr:hypothetical protein Y1Q_0005240 [Alligator mississippiensis]